MLRAIDEAKAVCQAPVKRRGGRDSDRGFGAHVARLEAAWCVWRDAPPGEGREDARPRVIDRHAARGGTSEEQAARRALAKVHWELRAIFVAKATHSAQ